VTPAGEIPKASFYWMSIMSGPIEIASKKEATRILPGLSQNIIEDDKDCHGRPRQLLYPSLN
jgi:hypothetical protein